MFFYKQYHTPKESKYVIEKSWFVCAMFRKLGIFTQQLISKNTFKHATQTSDVSLSLQVRHHNQGPVIECLIQKHLPELTKECKHQILRVSELQVCSCFCLWTRQTGQISM